MILKSTALPLWVLLGVWKGYEKCTKKGANKEEEILEPIGHEDSALEKGDSKEKEALKSEL